MEKAYNKRKFNHDYYAPFIYHIILKKRKNIPDFSRITGDPSFPPGHPYSARTDYFKLGFAIFNALKKFEKTYPEFIKKQYSIMPDHVHLILQKLKRTEIHLDDYMESLKKMVSEFYPLERENFLSPDEIFEEKYTDKLLFRNTNLNIWIEYVSHNPHRRAMIMKRPDFFTRIRNLKIGNEEFQAFGNFFLFRNPDKFAVRIRRNFTPQEVQAHREEALYAIETGAVIVSPFIAEKEKEIRREAERKGARIILFRHEEFGDKFKPSKHDFELCTQGRLLIISLGMPRGTKLSYSISTTMNELAKLLVSASLISPPSGTENC